MTLNLRNTRPSLSPQETREAADEDALDAICEIGDMIAGRVKGSLCETEYEFSEISLPSVVVGSP